ncbi:hypothetical protein MHU86_20926 [Fragilaria crotonensis]|nr:hypothetical protein MHU86_20926 [Fragilaria crotonensis]
MNKTCLFITVDVLCVFCGIASLYFLAATAVDHLSLEKSSATSATGYHLLSCPKLFKGRGTDSESKYTNIRLNEQSTAKLMASLENSLGNARVVHAGAKASSESRFQRNIAKVVEESGRGEDIDINIPGRSDNKNLCDILQDIMDEQIEMDSGLQPDDGAPHLTISILNLPPENNDSLLLRGSQFIRSSPLMSYVLKMVNLNDN